MTLSELIDLFSIENENKPTLSEKAEKNQRRKESLFLTCKQLREIAYLGFPFYEGILELSKRYSEKLTEKVLEDSIKELEIFISILEDSSVNHSEKAKNIILFNPENYITLTLEYLSLPIPKSLSRLNNVKKISQTFIEGNISLEKYVLDLENQILFFKELYSHLKYISIDNAFALILRYDIKTNKKKKQKK